MEQVVEYIVKQFTEFPDSVKVETIEDNGTNVVKVWVKEEDMGRVIGRHGHIAQAIRTIVKSIAIKTGKRYNVQIDSVDNLEKQTSEDVEAVSDDADIENK